MEKVGNLNEKKKINKKKGLLYCILCKERSWRFRRPNCSTYTGLGESELEMRFWAGEVEAGGDGLSCGWGEANLEQCHTSSSKYALQNYHWSIIQQSYNKIEMYRKMLL